VHSELFWGQHSSEDYLEYFNSYTGDFEITLTEAEPYKFLPRKANHVGQRILIDPRGMEKQGIDTLNLVLYLIPKKNTTANSPEIEKKTSRTAEPENMDVSTGPEIMTFYNINFIKGKAIILTRSRGALKDIYQKMLDNPTLEILIEGHTDNVGDEAALIDLSMDRALAIKGYLVHQGIDGDRMQVAGKGATEPLYQNGTESGREKNRRVEITLLKL
jgi:outer membrane protein OmpA-like peptidoglycan-associated protein